MRGPLVDVHQIGLHKTGNETWARNVVQELHRRGRDDVRYCVAPAGVEHLLAMGVDQRRLHVVSASSTVRLTYELPRLVRRLRPSALVSQYTLPRVRTRGVVVVHDCSFVQARAREWLTTAQRLRYRTSIGDSIRRSDAVLVPTEFVRQDLLSHYAVPSAKVHVAPLAADSSFLAADTSRAAPVAGRVIVVGDPLPRKNVSVVARAVAHANECGADLSLRVVGQISGRGMPEWQRAFAILGDRVSASGRVTQSALIAEYQSAAVFAYPSLSEGFGIPVLEAMALGVPVVASNMTALPEVVAGAGLIVEATDPRAWAEALQSASGPMRMKLAEAGLAHARRFSWRATVDVLEVALAG